MSLRSIYLDELNAMAKKRDPGFAAKVREVMVDRHPATLDPDEYDPVATVALAWEEVAPRGRAAFEALAENVIDSIDQARVHADPAICDWLLAHAVCRLLRMAPAAIIQSDLRGRCTRKLAGIIADRQDFLALVAGSHPEPNALWTDAFRLYLAWHPQEPAWLDTLWQTALYDTEWPPDEGACLLLEDAAASHPGFVTMPRLVAFWQAVHRRKADLTDQRRWFYLIGTTLENTPAGMARLDDILANLGGHLQDYRLENKHLPWNIFVEAIAAMFRNPNKRRRVLDFKTASPLPGAVWLSYTQIDNRFVDKTETIAPSLLEALAA
ncbi:MAG: hypothetical protein NTW21_44295 [Verrucomicrobia bacterium]|nr:hypothetical protein [Verrucomicrobiota bacterium]